MPIEVLVTLHSTVYGEDYQKLKQTLVDRLQEVVDCEFPDFKSSIKLYYSPPANDIGV